MTAIRKMNITVKLLLSPAVVFLLLLALAFYSFMEFGSQKNLMDQMYKKRFAMYRQSANLLNTFTTVNEGLFKIMTWSQAGYGADKIAADIQEQTVNLDEAAKQINAIIKEKALCTEEKNAYEKSVQQLADYRTWALKVMDMSSQDIATAAMYMETAVKKYAEIERNFIALKDFEDKTSNDYYLNSVARFHKTVLVFSILVFLSLAMSLAIVPFVSGLISKPVKRVVMELNAITSGEWNLTKRVPVESEDEIGMMTKGLNIFIEKLQSIISEINGNTNVLLGASREFSSSMTRISSNVEEMTAKSATVASATEQATANVNNISASAEEMSSGVSTVAASIEEMSASLTEVSKNCQKELQIVTDANNQTKSTRDMMERLDVSSKEIGKIIEVINDIAEQTNLLALNATIEAASAGDAGKGFAVVANEVKELAKQTAQATDQIGKQIEEMQTNTGNMVSAIELIAQVIEEVDSISHTIVSTVEEQSATVNEIAKSVGGASQAATEIAKNVSESAKGLIEVSSNIQGVNKAVTDTAGGVANIRQSAQDLSKLALGLQNIVGQFKVSA